MGPPESPCVLKKAEKWFKKKEKREKKLSIMNQWAPVGMEIFYVEVKRVRIINEVKKIHSCACHM